MSYFDDQVDPLPPKRGRRYFIGSLLTVIGSITIIALTVLPTPYVIERPGSAYNVLGENNGTPIISIPSTQTYATDGALDLLTVQIVGSPSQTPSWIELLFAWLNPAQAVLPVDLIFPPNQTQAQVNQENVQMFANSQQDATAAALTELGYSYTTRLMVAGLADGAAAAGKLSEGDQVTAIDGLEMQNYAQLTDTIRSSNGSEVTLTVIGKNGVERTEKVTPKLVEGNYRVGAFIAPAYNFPVDVKLELADIGGPSGGMMFALGIYDKLTPGFLNGGKIIAGTGTIDSSGLVGPIGGIRAKMYAAKDGGATWFLAPASNCNEVVDHIPSGIKVTKVETLKQAIAAVKAIASGTTDSLPTCSTSK